MAFHATLHDLLAKDERSKALFDSFPPDMQVALQEQRQNIHTHADLQRAAQSFQKQQKSW